LGEKKTPLVQGDEQVAFCFIKKVSEKSKKCGEFDFLALYFRRTRDEQRSEKPEHAPF
jgi:hypothetical protein